MGIDRLVDAIRAFDGSAGVVETAAGALGLPVLLVAAAALFSSLMSYVQQYIIATVGEELTLSLRRTSAPSSTACPCATLTDTRPATSEPGHQRSGKGVLRDAGGTDAAGVIGVYHCSGCGGHGDAQSQALSGGAGLPARSMTATATSPLALAQRAYGGNMAAMGR